MKRVALPFLAGVALFLFRAPAPGFSIQGEAGVWQYRMPIHIDYTKVPSDLANFPVLVAFDTAGFDFSKARSDGHDIRFTSNMDGTGVLKYGKRPVDTGGVWHGC